MVVIHLHILHLPFHHLPSYRQRWQAVVDCLETGDLSDIPPMCDFKYLRQYRPFSSLDALNFCVNIFDDGNDDTTYLLLFPYSLLP